MALSTTLAVQKCACVPVVKNSAPTVGTPLKYTESGVPGGGVGSACGLAVTAATRTHPGRALHPRLRPEPARRRLRPRPHRVHRGLRIRSRRRAGPDLALPPRPTPRPQPSCPPPAEVAAPAVPPAAASPPATVSAVTPAPPTPAPAATPAPAPHSSHLRPRTPLPRARHSGRRTTHAPHTVLPGVIQEERVISGHISYDTLRRPTRPVKSIREPAPAAAIRCPTPGRRSALVSRVLIPPPGRTAPAPPPRTSRCTTPTACPRPAGNRQ